MADYLELGPMKPSDLLRYVVAFFDAYHENVHFDALVMERQFTSMRFGGGANSAVLKCIPLELACWAKEQGIAFALLAPATIKKEVSGKGNAKKERVYSYVQHLWPKLAEMPKTHRMDVSDAIAIGVAAMKKNLFPDPPTP